MDGNDGLCNLRLGPGPGCISPQLHSPTVSRSCDDVLWPAIGPGGVQHMRSGRRKFNVYAKVGTTVSVKQASK
jgi:hypothetical protein